MAATPHNHLSRVAHTLLLSLLLLPFQNCSPVQFGSDRKEPAAVSRTENNGTGYGGKVYDSKLYWSTCADGSAARARFVTQSASAATMEREDCSAIAPLAISLSSPQAVAHYSTRAEHPFDLYAYNFKVFETSPPVTPLLPMIIAYACDGTDGGSRQVKMVLSEGQDGTGDTFVATLSTSGGVQAPVTVVTPNLTRTMISAGSKSFSGSSPSGDFMLMLNYSVFPYLGTVTFSGTGLNVNSELTCSPAGF